MIRKLLAIYFIFQVVIGTGLIFYSYFFEPSLLLSFAKEKFLPHFSIAWIRPIVLMLAVTSFFELLIYKKRSYLYKLITKPMEIEITDLWFGLFSFFFIYNLVMAFTFFPNLFFIEFTVKKFQITWGNLWVNNLLPQGPITVFLFIILEDFLEFLTHLLKHKVPFLWEFHKVHHSATEFTGLTNFRVHPGDTIFSLALSNFILVLVGLNIEQYFWLSNLLLFQQMFIHTNINIGLGWVGKYFIISPKFHRVHHLKEKVYHHNNFGFLFPWFDHLFGTYKEPPQNVADLPIGLEIEKKKEIGVLFLMINPYLKFSKSIFSELLSFLGKKKTEILRREDSSQLLAKGTNS